MATSKLIVLAAFDKNDEGDLVPALDPRQVDTEERAVREARMMAGSHAGVVAWSRDAYLICCANRVQWKNCGPLT